MNPKQKEEYRRLVARLSGRDRKELNRRAALARAFAQRDPSSPRTRWCVDRWALHLLEGEAAPSGPVAIVIQVDKGRATVRFEGADQVCELAREIAETQQSSIAPGDRVRLQPRDQGWTIRTVLPRVTALTRQDPGNRNRARTIVANVDVVVVVLSVVAPPLHPRIVDRYLAAIHKGGARAIVVVNKIDLHESREALEFDLGRLEPYRELDFPVFAVSTETETGLEAVRCALAGQTAVFVGHSGVGKSSLLNALAPEVHAVAGSVGATGRGQHTTTRSELIETGDLRIIDTPGIREFAVEFRDPAEVAECFAEFGAAGGCRFGDCLHIEEPGCAVRDAVRNGQISRARYLSYRRLVGETNDDDEPPDEPDFACRRCGSRIPRAGGGTQHRNHCPRCLHSLHLDMTPGDRAACCGSVMAPIAVWVRKGGEWALVHRCEGCGHLSSNRIAADDNEALLLSLAVQPISQPPFPLERIGGPI